MKWKNKLHLSAPFKAQGCGGNLSILKPGGAHTSTHTHRSTDQTPTKDEMHFVWLVQKGSASKGESWDGEIPKNYLKCSFVCLKEKQEDVNVWESLCVEVDRQTHANWMGLTFPISSDGIFSTISRAIFSYPRFTNEWYRRQNCLEQSDAHFSNCMKKKMWTTDYFELVHESIGNCWENTGPSSHDFFCTFSTAEWSTESFLAFIQSPSSPVDSFSII